MKTKKQAFSIVCIVAIAFIAIALLIPFYRNTSFWIAFVGMMGMFFVANYAFQKAFDAELSIESRLFGWPIAKVGVIGLLLQGIIAILLMSLAYFTPVWLAGLIEVLLYVFVFIALIGKEAMRDVVTQSEVHIQVQTNEIKALRSKAKTLPELCDDVPAKKLLIKLSEALDYADPISNDATKASEATLQGQLDDISTAIATGNIQEVVSLANQAVQTLAVRNAQCKNSKRL